jgi:DNA-binding HxlR family transcriptional regulator
MTSPLGRGRCHDPILSGARHNPRPQAMSHSMPMLIAHPLPPVRTALDEDTVDALQEAVGVLAAKWTLSVLARLATGTHRFNQLLRGIDGVSRRMLSTTLRQLERDGLVDRRVYARVPARVEYRLTPLGEELLRALGPLAGWGRQHHDTLTAARAVFDDALAPPPEPQRARESA